MGVVQKCLHPLYNLPQFQEQYPRCMAHTVQKNNYIRNAMSKTISIDSSHGMN